MKVCAPSPATQILAVPRAVRFLTESTPPGRHEPGSAELCTVGAPLLRKSPQGVAMRRSIAFFVRTGAAAGAVALLTIPFSSAPTFAASRPADTCIPVLGEL